jgi:hypothetical protein
VIRPTEVEPGLKLKSTPCVRSGFLTIANKSNDQESDDGYNENDNGFAIDVHILSAAQAMARMTAAPTAT